MCTASLQAWLSEPPARRAFDLGCAAGGLKNKRSQRFHWLRHPLIGYRAPRFWLGVPSKQQ